MPLSYPDLPGWKFSLHEVSPGVFRIQALGVMGQTIELSGPDPHILIDASKKSAAAMSQFILDPAVQAWLEAFLLRFDGVAGTVHRRDGDQLFLIAAIRIPPPVLQVTAVIPKGKGMAGLALERRQPVQTCNLQTDKSSDIRPGARAVNAQAAVALPIFDSAGEVRAVVGIAYSHEDELPPDKIAALSAAAESVP
jgi:hypothetical protein